VYQVALAPDGAHVATASERLRIWSVQRQEVEKVFDDFDGLVYSVAYSPSGDLLVAGNSDGTVVVWETADWKKRQELKEDWPIRSLVFSPDGKTLAVAGGKVERGIVELRSVNDLTLAKSLDGHKGAVTSASFSADGKTLVTCSIDKTVKLWTVGTGQIARSAASFEMGVSAVAISPTSNTVATGGFEGINLPGSK
jgi:WD40 repeat protein